MKIFISWSGERSHQVAKLLNDWIQCVIQAVNPWLSSKDIDKGSMWFNEITKELSNTQNGIVCLTKSNLNNPWILFEAGALAKGLESNRVYTFLIDLISTDVKDPLAQFNHTSANKTELYNLIRTINKGLESNALNDSILSNVFNTYWPQFEDRFSKILKDTKDEEIILERPQDDILGEILNSVRGIDKRLSKIEEDSINIDIDNYKINETLSSREIEIIKLICKQLSHEEISEALSISLMSVKTHINNIMKKINTDNAVGIAIYAVRNNLFSPTNKLNYNLS